MTRKTQKNLRKIAALVSCAVLIVCVTIGATVAYLTSTATVENTFTVGKVEIQLTEAKVNTAGEPIDGQGNVVLREDAPRVTTNEYKLVPGKTYTKDPTIHVAANSEECYLFVKLENGIASIEPDDLSSITGQMHVRNWKHIGDNIYAYYDFDNDTMKAVNAGTDGVDQEVFVRFTIRGDVTDADLKNIGKTDTSDGKPVTITAYAVQAEGFEGKTPVEIWNAAFEPKINVTEEPEGE